MFWCLPEVSGEEEEQEVQGEQEEHEEQEEEEVDSTPLSPRRSYPLPSTEPVYLCAR